MPGVETVDFEFSFPRRRNFVSTFDYRVAFWSWVFIFLLFVSFGFYELAVVFMQWNAYVGTARELDSSEYTGPRIPYLDVCEDRRAKMTHGNDHADPPFIWPAGDSGVISGRLLSTPKLSAECRWFKNGQKLDDGTGPAMREYYEITPDVKPRVLRDTNASSQANERYHCYRFHPSKTTSWKDIQEDDRLVIKWTFAIEGELPKERMDFGTKDEPLVKGLLYRLSLADTDDTWALHYEGLHSARHQLSCSNNVLVQGKAHDFTWVNSFGFTWKSGEKSTHTFDSGVFDEHAGCWRTGKTPGGELDWGEWKPNTPIRTELLFKVVYNTMDVRLTEFKNDSIARFMFSAAGCVAMFSLLTFVAWPFVSVARTEHDKLVFSAPFSADPRRLGEQEPLLAEG